MGNLTSFQELPLDSGPWRTPSNLAWPLPPQMLQDALLIFLRMSARPLVLPAAGQDDVVDLDALVDEGGCGITRDLSIGVQTIAEKYSKGSYDLRTCFFELLETLLSIFGSNSDKLEMKIFLKTVSKMLQTLIQTLNNFRLTFSTRSESSLAPMAPFFAFVYKHRELVKTGSQYVFFHDAPTLVRASSVRSRSRFYFIPSVTPCSAYTGDRQAWDSCSCTVPPFLSALSRTNYF